jgi:hypothetical protein
MKEAAHGIGESAARDLIDSVVRKGGSIPANPQAFVALWNYWDRTGGWGRYELIDETEETWRIRVHNNFLEVRGDGTSTRRQAFWEGYLHGFLNRALPEISAITMQLPETQRGRRVTMPAAVHVREVRFEPENEEADDFSIHFERGKLFSPLRGLIGARHSQQEGDYATAILWARSAFQSARQNLGETFDDYLSRRGAVVADADAFALLNSSDLPPGDAASADACLALANRILQDLVALTRETR